MVLVLNLGDCGNESNARIPSIFNEKIMLRAMTKIRKTDFTFNPSLAPTLQALWQTGHFVEHQEMDVLSC
jgi:hypothetical protein